MQIAKNTFLITGGASGLGLACVERFVKMGANIIIADRNEKLGIAKAQELGKNVRFALTNVVDEKSVQDAINLADKEFGSLHGVINCAGVGFPEKVLSNEGTPHSLESFSKTIQVNLIGSFNVIRLAAALMVKKNPLPNGERGVMISTASIAAFEGQIGQAAYSASKGGIVSLALPLARELSRYGIRVNTISPGIFDTPMLAGLSEPVRESLGKQVPFPSRLGKPEEYAFLAQHIVENEMLNGEVIRLDGAMRMAAK